MGRSLSHHHEWKAWRYLRVLRAKRGCWEGGKALGWIWGLVIHHSELCLDLAPYSKAGTGTEDRKIPGMAELAQPSSHHHTALRNNLGKVWDGPDEVEQCTQMPCQMWHLVLRFLVTDINWEQSNTGNCTHLILLYPPTFPQLSSYPAQK